MKGKRYTEQQILDILGQVEGGGAISEDQLRSCSVIERGEGVALPPLTLCVVRRTVVPWWRVGD